MQLFSKICNSSLVIQKESASKTNLPWLEKISIEFLGVKIFITINDS